MKKVLFAVLFFVLGFVTCFGGLYVYAKRHDSRKELTKLLKERMDFTVESVVLDPYGNSEIYQIALKGTSPHEMTSLNEARKFTLETVEQILTLVNEEHPEFKKNMVEFPFYSDHIILDLHFQKIDPKTEVIAVFLRDNHLYFFDEPGEVQFFSESLEETRRKVQEPTDL